MDLSGSGVEGDDGGFEFEWAGGFFDEAGEYAAGADLDETLETIIKEFFYGLLPKYGAG